MTACALAVLAMGSSRKPNFSACLAWDPFPDHVNRCYLPLAVLGAAMGRRCAYISCVAVWIIPGRSPGLMRYRMSVCTAHDKPPRLPECTRKPRRRNRTAANVPTRNGKKAAWSCLYYPHLTRCQDRARNQCLRSASLPGLTRNITRRCAGGTDAAADWTGHTKRKRCSRSL